MTTRVSGLYEAHLTVSDLPRSVAFYRDVVGLKHAHQIPARGVAFLWIDGRQTGMLGLWSAGHGPQAMRLHLAFRVDLEDVLGAAAVLKTKGVAPLGFHGEPSEEPVLIGWMPAVAQYFRGPDDHLIEFICPLEEQPDETFGIGPCKAWLAAKAAP